MSSCFPCGNEQASSKGLHAFASKAYFAVLDYYSQNYNNPAALAAFSPERVNLANAIAEILNNPLTPPRLYNAVGNFVCDISSQLHDDSPELIARALAFGNCGYVGCPGAEKGTICPGPEAHPAEKPAKRREH